MLQEFKKSHNNLQTLIISIKCRLITKLISQPYLIFEMNLTGLIMSRLDNIVLHEPISNDGLIRFSGFVSQFPVHSYNYN
jgi:hypothetical protein